MSSFRRRAVLVVVCCLSLGFLLAFTTVAADFYSPSTSPASLQEPAPPHEQPASESFQPPSDADSFEDLAPPDATWIDVTAQVAYPDLKPYSPEIPVQPAPIAQARTLTRVSADDNQAISFNNDLVGVVVEKDTFSSPVDLKFTLLAQDSDYLSPQVLLSRLSGQDLDPGTRIYEEGHTALAF